MQLRARNLPRTEHLGSPQGLALRLPGVIAAPARHPVLGPQQRARSSASEAPVATRSTSWAKPTTQHRGKRATVRSERLNTCSPASFAPPRRSKLLTLTIRHRMANDTVDGQNPATLSKHGKPLFVAIYREHIIPGFLRWCETDFVHPQYGSLSALLCEGSLKAKLLRANASHSLHILNVSTNNPKISHLNHAVGPKPNPKSSNTNLPPCAIALSADTNNRLAQSNWRSKCQFNLYLLTRFLLLEYYLVILGEGFC